MTAKHYVVAGFLLLVVGGYSYRAYETRWISDSERKAALQAIYSIDSMAADGITKSVYSQRESKAEALLADVHIAAHTHRDRSLADSVDFYFKEIQSNRAISDLGDKIDENEAQLGSRVKHPYARPPLSIGPTRGLLLKDLN